MPHVLPFAGLRFAAPSSELERLVSPPYDIISPDEQAQLRELSPHNAVYVELPSDAPDEPGSRYRLAAEALAAKPTLLLRYTRLMFTEHLKKRMQDLLGYGLAMEGLALMEQIDPPE